MPIVLGLGPQVTLSIDDLSVTLERCRDQLSFSSHLLTEYVIQQFYTDLLSPAWGGRSVLDPALKPRGYRFSASITISQWRDIEEIFLRQQDFASVPVNPGVTLDNEYQFMQVPGATPDRAVVPTTSPDTTTRPGKTLFYPREVIWIMPLDPDNEANFAGQTYDSQGNPVLEKDIEFTAIEFQRLPFVP